MAGAAMRASSRDRLDVPVLFSKFLAKCGPTMAVWLARWKYVSQPARCVIRIGIPVAGRRVMRSDGFGT